jgi:hypothetical protein
LVDSIGSLYTAINYAKSLNGNKSDDVIYFPKVKEDPFKELISFMEHQELNIEPSNNIMKHPVLQSIERSIQFSSEWNGTMMRLPFQIEYK